MRFSFVRLAKDPFTVLGLGSGATKAEIKARYRELARVYHPDSGGGNSEKMEQVNKAYNMLIKEGGYERLRTKLTSARPRSGFCSPSPFSKEAARRHNEEDKEEKKDVLTEEEIAKLSALDPDTERVTPDGKYMYQSRDDGSWMHLDRPLVRAHQPRYASHAAQAEMSEQLRHISLEKEKKENEKTVFQRAVDRLSDSADLPSRNPVVLRFCLVLTFVTLYLLYQRSRAWGKHRRSRADFYSSVEQQREELMRVYEENRDALETSISAAAIVFLAACRQKKETDPVVPPTPEEHYKAVRPPKDHFYVISGG